MARNPKAEAGGMQHFVGGDGFPASGDVQVGAQQIERAGSGAEQAGDVAVGVVDRAGACRCADDERGKALVECAKLIEQGMTVSRPARRQQNSSAVSP